MILVDCDVASTFAKIGRIDLLRKTFPGADIYITNSVYIELTKSRDEGLSFPEKVLARQRAWPSLRIAVPYSCPMTPK